MVRINCVLVMTLVTLCVSTHNVELAFASSFTPLKWQQEVKKHSNQAFVGQRKHQSWNRDQDHDFIDDEIKARFKPNQSVNVIVDLNECLPSSAIHDLLAEFGRITYIGKLITFVLLDDVPVKKLPKLAALSKVAMVEWKVPVHPANSIGGPAIQARKSITYSSNTAEDGGLTGAGVNIAILDYGVDNAHSAFSGKFLVGYDAFTGGNDPADNYGHGTHVAGTALGLPTQPPPPMCRTPDDGTPADCGGVAPGAKLVDIKVCDGSAIDPCNKLADGLEWLGINARTYNIRVANISLATECVNDDGSTAIPQLVDYLVALGIAVVISHGNANPFGPGRQCAVGAQITSSPGSSSFAMTVAATEDKDVAKYTIKRDDDVFFNGSLSGPRTDFDLMLNPNPLALKPDFSAPGVNIISAEAGTGDKYTFNSGTSMAAPFVAGAAALIIESQPNIDPGSLKDLFRLKADSNQNSSPPYASVDPMWEPKLGSGMINVYQALSGKTTDIGFPNCVGPPVTLGGLCQVTAPQPPWNNSFDITTLATPQQGVTNTITAQVQNFGPSPATVLVNFGVYEFAVGNNQFFHIGTKQVTIPAMATVPVDQSWTPADSNHQCVQVSIQFGLDSNFDNNVTQRNLMVAPSVYEIRIENPFMVPARIEIRPKSNHDGWICQVKEELFMLSPFEDCPRKLRVPFNAPPGALPGERANCDIAVYATPEGSDKAVLIGGVTVQTFVPKPCRIVGQIIDKTNNPIPQARLVFSRALRPNEARDPSVAEERPLAAVTDEDGIFSVYIPPSLEYTILVEQPTIGKGQVEQRLECGIGRNKYVLSREGVKRIDN